jgi:hypothetical protein
MTVETMAAELLNRDVEEIYFLKNEENAREEFQICCF